MSYLNPRDFYFEVTKGSFAGVVDGIDQSSYQLLNSMGVEADIWGSTGNLVWQTSAVKLDITSSNANDTSAGTGARTLTISGLDLSLNPITENISLNGLTAVTTTLNYFRINRAFVLTTGTYGGSNIGVITLRVTGGGSIQGVIPEGNGRIAGSHFTVPAGKRFLIRNVNMASEAGKAGTTFKIYYRGSLPVTAPYGTKQLKFIYTGMVGGFTELIQYCDPLPAGTDVWVTATPGANNVAVSFDIQGMFV